MFSILKDAISNAIFVFKSYSDIGTCFVCFKCEFFKTSINDLNYLQVFFTELLWFLPKYIYLQRWANTYKRQYCFWRPVSLIPSIKTFWKSSVMVSFINVFLKQWFPQIWTGDTGGLGSRRTCYSPEADLHFHIGQSSVQTVHRN